MYVGMPYLHIIMTRYMISRCTINEHYMQHVNRIHPRSSPINFIIMLPLYVIFPMLDKYQGSFRMFFADQIKLLDMEFTIY